MKKLFHVTRFLLLHGFLRVLHLPATIKTFDFAFNKSQPHHKGIGSERHREYTADFAPKGNRLDQS